MPLSLDNEKDIIAQISNTARAIVSKAENLSYNNAHERDIILKYKDMRDKTSNFMKTDSNGENVIDRHKVAAGMAVAILKYSPIRIKNDSVATKKDRSANYYLAYLSAINIIKDFYKEETLIDLVVPGYVRSYMNHFRDLLKFNHGMVRRISTTTHQNEPEESQCIFFISHMMFHLEKIMVDNKKIEKISEELTMIKHLAEQRGISLI
jgi:hypothetical protein